MIGIEDVLSQKEAELTDSKLNQPHSIWMLPITNLSYIIHKFILGWTKRNELSCCMYLEANFTLRQSVQMCLWMQYLYI